MGHGSPRASQPGVELDQPLIGAAGRPAGSTTGSRRGSGADEAPEVTPDTDMAKSLRKTCCSWFLKFLGCAIVFAVLAYFTGVLAADQYYYDHCYNQVQLGAEKLIPVGRSGPYDDTDWAAVPTCRAETAGLTGDKLKTNLKWQTEHRIDLFDYMPGDGGSPGGYRPKCRCCNDKVENPELDKDVTPKAQYNPVGWCQAKCARFFSPFQAYLRSF